MTEREEQANAVLQDNVIYLKFTKTRCYECNG